MSKQEYSKPSLKKASLLDKIKFHRAHEDRVLVHESINIWWSRGILMTKEGDVEKRWTSAETLVTYIES